jgi:hypothetical protein
MENSLLIIGRMRTDSREILHDPMSGRTDCGLCLWCENPISHKDCWTQCFRPSAVIGFLPVVLRETFFSRLHISCRNATSDQQLCDKMVGMVPKAWPEFIKDAA